MSQNGGVLQTLKSEEKRIREVQVGQGRKVFMVRSKAGLSFYAEDKARKNRWNLWKRMFVKTSDSIVNANLLASDRFGSIKILIIARINEFLDD